MMLPAIIAAAASGIGVAQLVVGTLMVRRFARQPRPSPSTRPPVTLLRPLCGMDARMEASVETVFNIDYPEYQIVFGVQDPADPVIELVERLRARYPARDVTLVVDGACHGFNRKVSNLINMLPSAKHDVLVMSDADVHVAPSFLNDVVVALEGPGVGLVTSLYTGLPVQESVAGYLGAAQINYTFLPGVLLARALGRQDGLGATMALTRQVLAEIGGFAVLVNHLADDQVMGRFVLAKGYKIALASCVPATTVAETTLPAMFRHELRWARTIRALVPVAYAASILQFPQLWAMLAILLSGVSGWGFVLLGFVLTARLACADVIRNALNIEDRTPWVLFPLRAAVSAAIYVASFTGNRVYWRGHEMNADAGDMTQIEPRRA
jgi:ceramide glucosyltransferase